METKPPRKKKNAHRSSATRAPFPIFVRSPYGFFTDDSLAPVFRGCFNGYSVVVDNADEMKMLYEMGCFGKGSLSRSFPNFGKRKKEHPPVVFETQWKRRKEWIDRLQKSFGCQLISDEPLDKPESSSKSDPNPSDACSSSTDEKGENWHKESEKCSSTGSKVKNAVAPPKDSEVLVVSDLNKKKLDFKLRVEVELVETVVEVHHLSLEEAFFLSYGLGCLDIVNLADDTLSPDESWNLFKDSQNDFVECYVAYHHYRSKGFVVKSGLKYGGHFLLYHSKGPSFYHGSYIVIVENIGKSGGVDNAADVNPSWDKYLNLNRIAEQSNKEVIVCQVRWPSTDADVYKSPEIIQHFRVKDCTLGRWNPSSNLSPDTDD